MLKFGLVGDGYIADRHKKAIQHIKGELIWVYDPTKNPSCKLDELNLNVDYVLCLGSDDLISNSLLDKYIESMEFGYDFIGLLDCFIYDRLTNDLRFWVGYNGIRIGETAGIGRCLSKRILDEFDWKPWVDAHDRGLDGTMFRKLKEMPHTEKVFGCLKDNIFAVDLKDSQSMTSFEHFNKYPKFNKELMFNECPETNE